MATYTMQLKTYIEKFSQHMEGLTPNERIKIGREHLFDFHYPFFDENYREQFETNFIRNFYIREIGFETEGLFKQRLENWLSINMTYYNNLFESERIKYDPLINSHLTTQHEKNKDTDQEDERKTNQSSETDGKSTTDSDQDTTANSKTNQKGKSDTDTTDDNFNRKLQSDTPDSRLAITTKDGEGVIEYASSIDEDKQKNKGSSKTNDTNDTDTKTDSKTKLDSTDQTHVESLADMKDDLLRNINEKEKYLQKTVGKIGAQSYAKMVQEYRSALLRIEVQIYREMQQLFMMIY